MTDDARFEDAREAPLNLGAFEPDDLAVISSLVQDSVFPSIEMRWDRAQHRFGLLLNRFRWEDGPDRKRAPERVQSLLVFDTVGKVSTSGSIPRDGETVLSVLSVTYEETDAPAGHILITLAGDGAIRLSVEALEVTLKDVTRPYVAPSKKSPQHPD